MKELANVERWTHAIALSGDVEHAVFLLSRFFEHVVLHTLDRS